MITNANTTARIRFLAATHDEEGQTIHYVGEEIVGEVFARRQDFLFVRTTAGTCMCVDSSRTDLHVVELECCVAG